MYHSHGSNVGFIDKISRKSNRQIVQKVAGWRTQGTSQTSWRTCMFGPVFWRPKSRKCIMHNIITDHVPSDHYWTKCWLDFPSYLKPSSFTNLYISNTVEHIRLGRQHLASSDYENLRGRTPHPQMQFCARNIRPSIALLLYLVILGHEPTSSLNNPSIRPNYNILGY